MASDVPGDQQPFVSPSQSAEIDTLSDQFEAAWLAGRRPGIEEYLPWLSESGQAELFDKLLGMELALRLKAGEQPTPAEYVSRLPAHKQQIEAVFARMATAFESADRSLDSSLGRPSALQVRCPHCHNPIELVDGNMLEQITCPSCGSQFALAADETLDFQPGTETETCRRMIGHFELIERLGVGGFGAVWKAHDTQLDRIVAVKIPRRSNIGHEEIEKFLREARTAAQLQHPNIVSVHEVGIEGDTIFIVSDFIEGTSLDKWLTDHRLTHRESAELCVKIAKALHYSHEHGVIHRDMKPANVMLNAAGEPHIMDFGLAKREAGEITMTHEGQILGTPAYMSPEQAEGEGHAVDIRTDVYSLGAILFELLTGDRPFRAKTVRMLLKQVIEDEPPSPRTFDGRIPHDLETICLKCLEKEPRRRYGSARDLGDELDRCVEGKPIKARPIGKLHRTWRWCRRNPLGATIAALLFFVGVAGPIAAVTQRSLRQEAERARIDEATQRAEAERLANENMELAENERIARGKAERLAENNRQLAEKERSARTDAEHQLRLTTKLLYFSRIALAQRMWSANDVKGVRRALDACPAALRNWEWNYLKRLCESGLLVSGAHMETVTFSPNGKWIAVRYYTDVGSTGGTKRRSLGLWDATTGEALRTFEGYSDYMFRLAFSPDSTRLAAAGHDGVMVWDVTTGRTILNLADGHEGIVACVGFHPDGTRIASGGFDEKLKIWDVNTCQEESVLAGHTATVSAVAFSPDGTRIATGGADRTVRIWDATTSQQMFTLEGHAWTVKSVAFSPDGKRLVSASMNDAAVRVWDAATGEQVLTLDGHTGEVTSATFSPNGRWIASSSEDKTVRIWDATSGEDTCVFRGHVSPVLRVSFGPDGERLVSASKEEVRVWCARGQEASKLKMPRHIRASGMAFGPNGKCIATGGSGQVLMWNVTKAKRLWESSRHGTYMKGVAFSGNLVASSAYGREEVAIRIWDATTGGLVRILEGHARHVNDLAFSPDGREIVSSSEDGTVKIWDVANGEERRTIDTIDAGSDIVSAVKRWLLVRGGPSITESSRERAIRDPNEPVFTTLDERLLVIDVTVSGMRLGVPVDERRFGGEAIWRFRADRNADGDMILVPEGRVDRLTTVAFSPDGAQIASGCERGVVKIWDAATGTELVAFEGHDGRVCSVAFSPDGTLIASGSNDKTIRLWDAATGALALTLEHVSAVWEAAFSPDGTRIVSGGSDGTIRIWDVALGQEVFALTGHDGAVANVTFSPDGRLIGSSGRDGTVRVWDARSLEDDN